MPPARPRARRGPPDEHTAMLDELRREQAAQRLVRGDRYGVLAGASLLFLRVVPCHKIRPAIAGDNSNAPRRAGPEAANVGDASRLEPAGVNGWPMFREHPEARNDLRSQWRLPPYEVPHLIRRQVRYIRSGLRPELSRLQRLWLLGCRCGTEMGATVRGESPAGVSSGRQDRARAKAAVSGHSERLAQRQYLLQIASHEISC